MTINFGSDFSGIGAFNQALMRLKIPYKEIFACEMDENARIQFCRNYGTDNDFRLAKENKSSTLPYEYSFYYPKDVYLRDIPASSLDIYVSTPPCQAFSLIGDKKGEDDARGILFYNTHEFIMKNRPRYFIIENVKGLISNDKGRTFQRWIDHLGGKSINGNRNIFPIDESAPYHIYHKVINSMDFGVPQSRERIFIIGIRDDKDNEFTFPKGYPLERRMGDIFEKDVPAKYYLSEKMIKYFNTRKDNFNNGKINYKYAESIASTLTKSSASIDISDNIINIDGKLRKLTPREHLRLMDFPDSFDFDSCKDTHVYNQSGNSVVVQCYVELLNKLKF